jgi:cytokinin dehydrogenase
MTTTIVDHAYFRQLQQDGILLDDAESLAWAGRDWGRLINRPPLGVLRPRTVTDIAEFARLAAGYSHPLTPRGQGHSSAGQAQAPGGFVVDMRAFTAIHQVGPNRIVVGAGARWSQVLAETLPRGLTPAVLTDYLELSVGGTLSAGGIGGATQHYGLQVDNVLELEVVTPQGEVVTCSADRNVELFDNVRAGYGRYGTITCATVRLVPAHTRTRRFQLYYDDLSVFLADQRRLLMAGCFDYLEGQVKLEDAGNSQYMIEAASFYSDEPSARGAAVLAELAYQRGTEEIEEMTYFEFLNRLADGEVLLRAAGVWDQCHPWVNLFLPDSATEPIVANAIKGLVPNDIGEAGFILIYPFRTSKISAPRLELPDEPIVFLFAVDRTAPPEDKAEVQRMLVANELIYEHAKAAGATTYLGAPVAASDTT